MAYEDDDVRQASEIIYTLLQQKELAESTGGAQYQAYIRSEQVQALVEGMAQTFGCLARRFDNVLYLIPDIDNRFLGYQKKDMKEEMLRSGATDREYYLAQFAILVLLVDFYDGQGSSARTRDSLRVGDWQNHIAEELQRGAQAEEERREREERDGRSQNGDWAPDDSDTGREGGADGSRAGRADAGDAEGLDYTGMLRAYEALRSEEGSRKRTTKEGMLNSILDFLEKQGLVNYVEDEGWITTTKKLDNFMDWQILNLASYQHMMDLMGVDAAERSA